MHTLGAIAEFERARIAERAKAGLARVRRQVGTWAVLVRTGSPESAHRHLSIRLAAHALGVSRSVLHRARLSQKPVEIAPEESPEIARSFPSRRLLRISCYWDTMRFAYAGKHHVFNPPFNVKA